MAKTRYAYPKRERSPAVEFVVGRFFWLPATLRALVLRDWADKFGEESAQYAESAFGEWKSGHRRMSSETIDHVIATVPAHLMFPDRLALARMVRKPSPWAGRRVLNVATAEHHGGVGTLVQELTRLRRPGWTNEATSFGGHWLTIDVEETLLREEAAQEQSSMAQQERVLAQIQAALETPAPRPEQRYEVPLPWGEPLQVTVDRLKRPVLCPLSAVARRAGLPVGIALAAGLIWVSAGSVGGAKHASVIPETPTVNQTPPTATFIPTRTPTPLGTPAPTNTTAPTSTPTRIPTAPPTSPPVVVAPACYVPGRDTCNCSNFVSSYAATMFMQTYDPADVNRLDGDHDGIACEDSPSTGPSSGGGTRIGAICNDGTTSSATGSGACSHHRGVAQWITR